jgi:HK97 family phage major capsid protein
VVVSEAVLTDASVIDVVELVGRNIGRGLGRVIGIDLPVGTGSGEPRGLMTALAAGAGSATTGGSLIGPTYERILDTAWTVNDSYRTSLSAGWLCQRPHDADDP